MALFNSPQLNTGVIVGNVQQKLMDLRKSLHEIKNLHDWFQAISLTDLEAVGFTPADAQALLTAIADASAMYFIYTNGLPPANYPQPPTSYPYGASTVLIIGPQ